MMEYFVVYDTETGEMRWKGQGPVGTAITQLLPDSLAAVVVPQAALTGAELNYDVLRAFAANKIDAGAETERQKLITSGFGQMLTYQQKASEAAKYLSNNDGEFPFLTAEAASRGITVHELAVEVDGNAKLWLSKGALIEAARMAAKARLATATNMNEISAAMSVEWPS